MEPEPTPRSLAASGSLEAATVAELTGQVFQSLSNGKASFLAFFLCRRPFFGGGGGVVEAVARRIRRLLHMGCKCPCPIQDTIGLQDFKTTAKFLAQLSEDFTDPEEAFSRIDENQDYRIDRAEFEQEINQIRGLLGTRKLAAALGQVQQDLQIRQSFVEETVAQEQAPEIETLDARTQVLEQMVGYFSTLREDYSQRLDDLKQQQVALQAREDLGKAKAPPRARIFGGRSKKTEPSTKMNLAASLSASAQLEIKRQYTHQDDFDGPDGQAAEIPDGEDEEGENEDPEEDVSNEDPDEENEDEELDEDLEDDEDDEDEEEVEEDDVDEVDEVDEGRADEATQLVSALSASEAPPKGDLETTLPPGSLPVLEEEQQEQQGPQQEETEAQQAPAVVSQETQGEQPEQPEQPIKDVPSEPVPAEAATEPQGPGVPEASTEATGPQPAGKKAKASKKKAKAKPKKEAAPKKSQAAPAKADSQRPSQGPSHLSQRPSLSGAAEPAEPSSTKSAVAKPAKKAVDEEGFRCVQTLEMGLAIRNAICIGTEVWTVDWAGNVTVRERDDATKVRSEIPTNRFLEINCMVCSRCSPVCAVHVNQLSAQG